MSLNEELIKDISNLDLIEIGIKNATNTRNLKEYAKLLNMRVMELVIDDEKLDEVYKSILDSFGVSDEVKNYIKEHTKYVGIKKHLYSANNIVLDPKMLKKLMPLIKDIRKNPSNKAKHYTKIKTLIYLKKDRGDDYAIGIYNVIRDATYIIYNAIRKTRKEDNNDESAEDSYGDFEDGLEDHCDEDYMKIMDIYFEYLLENYPNLV